MAQYKISNSTDGKEIVTTTYVVHSFKLGDVEDPDIYAAEPLYNWEHSEAGQWVMKNAMETPSWHRCLDYNIYGYQYQIRAELTLEQITFFELKYK